MQLQQMFAATFSVFALASSWLSLLPATAADVEPTISKVRRRFDLLVIDLRDCVLVIESAAVESSWNTQ